MSKLLRNDQMPNKLLINGYKLFVSQGYLNVLRCDIIEVICIKQKKPFHSKGTFAPRFFSPDIWTFPNIQNQNDNSTTWKGRLGF